MADRTMKRNDLSPPLVIIARDAVGPADLESATALFRMTSVLTGVVKVNAAAQVAAGLVFTASGATLTSPDHGLNNDESVTVKTTGTLPAGLSLSKEYFIVNATENTLQLSLTKGGAAIVTTSAGTGMHELLSGRVTYDWQLGDTDTAGTYFAEVQTIVDGEQLTYPNTRQFLVEVIADLA